MLQDSLWQCFLRNSGESGPVTAVAGTIETAGIDSAKLLCCGKARTSSCRNLCVKVRREVCHSPDASRVVFLLFLDLHSDPTHNASGREEVSR